MGWAASSTQIEHPCMTKEHVVNMVTTDVCESSFSSMHKNRH
jgi:hypothetical protein